MKHLIETFIPKSKVIISLDMFGRNKETGTYTINMLGEDKKTLLNLFDHEPGSIEDALRTFNGIVISIILNQNDMKIVDNFTRERMNKICWPSKKLYYIKK